MVTVHGFSTNMLLQALPCLPSSPPALPLPTTVWLGILLGRLDAQQFLESIVVGIADRRSGCRRR